MKTNQLSEEISQPLSEEEKQVERDKVTEIDKLSSKEINDIRNEYRRWCNEISIDPFKKEVLFKKNFSLACRTGHLQTGGRYKPIKDEKNENVYHVLDRYVDGNIEVEINHAGLKWLRSDLCKNWLQNYSKETLESWKVSHYHVSNQKFNLYCFSEEEKTNGSEKKS